MSIADAASLPYFTSYEVEGRDAPFLTEVIYSISSSYFSSGLLVERSIYNEI